MAIVAVYEQEAEVGASAQALEVRLRGHPARVVPLHEVEELQLYGGAELTSGARNRLLAAGVEVVFLTLDGRVRGRLLPDAGHHGDRRLAQYRAVADDARRLAVARGVVAGKVRNQRANLLQRQRHLRSDRVGDALVGLRAGLGAVGSAADLDQLRGIEGEAAARYFGVFDELVRNPAFGWTGRNRRPPRDPVNACLSYGYALLYVRADAAVRAAGLDPYLGVLHEAGRGRCALSLDLMEEFRPAVDGLVLTLLNRGQLGPEDFGPPDADLLADEPAVAQEGAVYLSRVGRTILLRAWSRRLAQRSEHPALENDWTFAGLIRAQAHALRRALLDGEPYRAAEVT